MSCLSNCPICLDTITNINCTTTECGHVFHSNCIFTNLMKNVGCPLCRKALVEESEEEESDEEEEEEEEESIVGEQNAPKITIRQINELLRKKGYTEKDYLNMILFEIYGFEEETRDGGEVSRKNDSLIDIIDDIFDGDYGVDYRDNRTYAEVLIGKKRMEEAGVGPEPIIL